MIIEKLIVGEFQSCCYIAAGEDGGDAVVIDPGAEPGRIIEVIKRHHWNVTHIINTHGHVDHIAANGKLKEKEKLQKSYKYSMLLKVPKKMPNKISFKNALQIVQTKPKRRWKEFARKFTNNEEKVMNRLYLAKNWIEKYAPKEFIIRNKKV